MGHCSCVLNRGVGQQKCSNRDNCLVNKYGVMGKPPHLVHGLNLGDFTLMVHYSEMSSNGIISFHCPNVSEVFTQWFMKFALGLVHILLSTNLELKAVSLVVASTCDSLLAFKSFVNVGSRWHYDDHRYCPS